MNKRVNDESAQKPTKLHSNDHPLGHVPLRTADAHRSFRNVSQWNAYLPTDCVRTMVRMGWDYTT